MNTYKIFYLLVFSPIWYGLGMFGSLSFIIRIHIHSSDSFSVRWFELVWTPSKTAQFVAICIASDFSAPASFTPRFSAQLVMAVFPQCVVASVPLQLVNEHVLSLLSCVHWKRFVGLKPSYAFQTRWLESVAGDVFWHIVPGSFQQSLEILNFQKEFCNCRHLQSTTANLERTCIKHKNENSTFTNCRALFLAGCKGQYRVSQVVTWSS